MEAARYGELDEVRQLLDGGVSPDAQDESGRTGEIPH